MAPLFVRLSALECTVMPPPLPPQTPIHQNYPPLPLIPAAPQIGTHTARKYEPHHNQPVKLTAHWSPTQNAVAQPIPLRVGRWSINPRSKGNIVFSFDEMLLKEVCTLQGLEEAHFTMAPWWLKLLECITPPYTSITLVFLDPDSIIANKLITGRSALFGKEVTIEKWVDKPHSYSAYTAMHWATLREHDQKCPRTTQLQASVTANTTNASTATSQDITAGTSDAQPETSTDLDPTQHKQMQRQRQPVEDVAEAGPSQAPIAN
ncbi:hypothetical protein BJV74DRAFT_795286 [Russula compacta]|nr:hypothetical protein BJV74DRAFT_795286 [Russula compacta]